MEGPSFWFLTALSVFWTSTVCLEYDFHEDVFEVAVDNRTENVFVGGNNIVYMLAKDLQVLQNATLSDCARASKNCNNRVTVLEVDHTFRHLLVCGSDREGQCWFLDLEDLSKKRLLSGRGSRIQAGRLQRPIVQQIVDGSPRTLNVSTWIVTSPNTDRQSPSTSQSKPILSVRQIRSSGSNFSMDYSHGVDKSVIRKYNSSFYFDFVDGFCLGDECVYLTLQQMNASSSILTSRIASVCARAIFPYVEIPFEEAKHNALSETSEKVYNRAIAFSLGKIGYMQPDQNTRVAKYVVVSVFGKTSEKTSTDVNPREGFAVSAVWLTDELQKWIRLARNMCAASLNFTYAPKSPDWYTADYARCRPENEQVNYTLPSNPDPLCLPHSHFQVGSLSETVFQ